MCMYVRGGGEILVVVCGGVVRGVIFAVVTGCTCIVLHSFCSFTVVRLLGVHGCARIVLALGHIGLN